MAGLGPATHDFCSSHQQSRGRPAGACPRALDPWAGHDTSESASTRDGITEQVIGLAIEVHRHTGTGLLESVYEQCPCHELRQAGISFERQVPIPVTYKGLLIGDGFKADIVVAGEVILEIKAVAAILPVHESQLHTYLSMSGIHIGLILNFHARRMVDGIRRRVV